jgi:hypothetical protein
VAGTTDPGRFSARDRSVDPLPAAPVEVQNPGMAGASTVMARRWAWLLGTLAIGLSIGLNAVSLQGMADRLDAVGGSLDVRSAPGAGTTIAGRVPARSLQSA